MHVKNLTNSPHKIKLADGKEGRISARGEGEFDIDPKWLPFYERAGYLRISEKAAKPDPLDHDEDGKKGGSIAPEASDDLSALRKDYQDIIGKRPFMGWNASELRERIDAKLAE